MCLHTHETLWWTAAEEEEDRWCQQETDETVMILAEFSNHYPPY